MQQLCQRSLSNLNRICPWPRTVSHWPSLLLQSKVPRPIHFKLEVHEAEIKVVLNGLCCPMGNCLNPLSPNSVQDQFSPNNYPYKSVKR